MSFLRCFAVLLPLLAFGCAPADEPAPNQAPTCTITAPAEGDAFASGAEVALEADIVDPEDGYLSIYWTSTASGAIADGASASVVLPDGAQILTVQALDDAGDSCDASVAITVGATD